MLLKGLFLANFIASEGFCFQHHLTNSSPKLEDFVWFEDPGTETLQHSDLKIEKYNEETWPNLEDLVWFDTPDYTSFKSDDSMENVKLEVKEIKVIEENPWKNEDEIFANYFYANKWK